VARKIRFDLALVVIIIIIIITGICIVITGRVKFELQNASGTASRAVQARRGEFPVPSSSAEEAGS
jgi:hypothetical protein